jgi:hypothetical protein
MRDDLHIPHFLKGEKKMAYKIKLKIQPSINKNLKIYVYRSKNQTDIESIGKVKNLLPVIVLDESTYPSNMMEDGHYIIYDASENPESVIYNGPQPTAIPTNEYETIYDYKPLNEYNGYNVMNLKPLPLNYTGTLYYYSIIGVDSTNSLITHISRVKAEILQSDYINKGTREIQYCNDYNALPTDIWETLTTVNWETNITFGDMSDTASYTRFGTPFINEVKIFDMKDVIIDTRCVINFNHITLTIPNIWQMDNQKYNYRKLKSFRIRNIYDEHYGDWSEPTYPSILPVAIERLLVLRKDVTTLTSEERQQPIGLDELDDTLVYTVIRRNGKFYTTEDVSLNYNRYTLNEDEGNKAVYSETSVQPEIVFNFNARGNTVYNYTFYLEDIYGKYSAPTVVVVEC